MGWRVLGRVGATGVVGLPCSTGEVVGVAFSACQWTGRGCVPMFSGRVRGASKHTEVAIRLGCWRKLTSPHGACPRSPSRRSRARPGGFPRGLRVRGRGVGLAAHRSPLTERDHLQAGYGKFHAEHEVVSLAWTEPSPEIRCVCRVGGRRRATSHVENRADSRRRIHFDPPNIRPVSL